MIKVWVEKIKDMVVDVKDKGEYPNCDNEAKGLMVWLVLILVELWIVYKCGVEMLACLPNKCFVYLVEF